MSEEQPEKKKGFKHHPHLWLCVLLTFGEFALIYIVFFVGVPAPNKEIAYMMTGGYSAEWARSISYWYNTTFGSNNKNEIIAQAQPVDIHK